MAIKSRTFEMSFAGYMSWHDTITNDDKKYVRGNLFESTEGKLMVRVMVAENPCLNCMPKKSKIVRANNLKLKYNY